MQQIQYDTSIASKQADKYNYGLALLKIWMCFEVVLAHFKNWDGVSANSASWFIKTLWRYRGVAVPVFMLSSFVLTNMATLATDNIRIKRRYYRLFIPHVCWALIYYVVYRLLDMYKGLGLENGITDLLWQLLLGHSINQTEWFQVDLIIITTIFIFGFKLNRKQALKFTLIIGLCALYLQYTGLNGAMFDNIIWPQGFSSGYVTYPIGRIMEMIPYASLGIILCHYRLLDRIKHHCWFIVIFSAMVLHLLLNYSIFTTVERNYGYSGLYYIATGTASVMLFYAIPLEIIPNICKRGIRFVSRYTLSVYFMHRLVATLIYNTRLANYIGMKQGSMHDCIIIYLCCIIIAWLISLVPVKILKDIVM